MTKSSRSKSFSVGEYNDVFHGANSTSELETEHSKCTIHFSQDDSSALSMGNRHNRIATCYDSITLDSLTQQRQISIHIEESEDQVNIMWLLNGGEQSILSSKRSIDPLLLESPILQHRLQGGTRSNSREHAPQSKLSLSRLNPFYHIGRSIQHDTNHWLWAFYIVSTRFSGVAISGLLWGFVIGAAPGALGSHNSDMQPQISQIFAFDTFLDEFFTSCHLIGGLIGCLIQLLVGDRFGRLRALQFAACCYVVGSLLTGIAMAVWLLFLGQIIYGIGTGLTAQAAPLYIGESVPSKNRGALVSIQEVMEIAGVLLGYASAWMLQDIGGGWRMMYAFSAFMGIISAILLLTYPKSPRWLASKMAPGRAHPTKADRATIAEILMRVDSCASPHDIGKEVDSIFANVHYEYQVSENLSRMHGDKWWTTHLLHDEAVRLGLSITGGLVLFQQMTGHPSAIAYVPFIFESVGLHHSALAAATIVATAKLIATIVAAATVDSYGRRRLLLVGTSVMAISLFLLGLTLSLHPSKHATFSENTTSIASQLTLICLIAYSCGFQLGFGPCTWLVATEVFPLYARSRALSIVVLVDIAVNYLVTQTFLSLYETLHYSGLFFMYAVIAIMAVVFIQTQVFETRYRSLEEIECYVADVMTQKRNSKTQSIPNSPQNGQRRSDDDDDRSPILHP